MEIAGALSPRAQKPKNETEDKAMKNLYEANDNYQNYILIRDMDRDENDTCVCDWDLSEDEVKKIAEAFERGEYDEKDAVEEPEWFPFDEVRTKFNAFHSLWW
jgi:hypothetical protein